MRMLAVLLMIASRGGMSEPEASAMAQATWADQVLNVPYDVPDMPGGPVLQLVRQDFEQLERGRSVIKTPLRIGSRQFEHGLGAHSVGHIRVYSPDPIERFSAWIGVDHNERTQGGAGSVGFSVHARGEELHRSRVMRGGQEPVRIDVDVGGAHVLDLHVDDGGDGPACDHADWAEAVIVTRAGKTIRLDEIEEGLIPTAVSRHPFSFRYGERRSDEVLEQWKRERSTEALDDDRTQVVTTWADPATGLRLRWEAIRYADFPALEWVLYFENAGEADTLVISDIQALDLSVSSPLDGTVPYRLHSCRGGTPDPQQFEPTATVIDEKASRTLGSGNGRSSTMNFPFFRVETGEGSIVAAVGWSGCWRAGFECADRRTLRMRAGMERTHFVLRPGERVRSPRILLLQWPGDTLGSNAQFRQLIYKHYVARHAGERPLPALFCNTCFTRGGGWLNECNAENQTSLIRAYGPLGLEALITDAGWFEGGWPAGAGNWDPRRDAYPEGMGPVAAAAAEEGMIYGLWFEPERVVAGTAIHREHPEWCLASQDEPQQTYLLNFGLREVQDHFFDIVRGFMKLPGFRVYRQDFNMDPLAYWRFNDPPDRQGITEIRYIEGLYAYWDRIRSTWPDALLEECASGGHRIDLETLMRMHIHQKTDYWFDNEVDQAALWSVSQYLPNNTIVAHLNRTDEYSFHSTMASSLCLGWIADAPDFDAERGKKLLDQYRRVRHLLIGAWYPLLPYNRDPAHWIASQYHRPDLDEGMILAFRRPESPYRTVEVSLHGLEPDAMYELSYESSGEKARVNGGQLMKRFELTIPRKRGSELIVYRRAGD